MSTCGRHSACVAFAALAESAGALHLTVHLQNGIRLWRLPRSSFLLPLRSVAMAAAIGDGPTPEQRYVRVLAAIHLLANDLGSEDTEGRVSNLETTSWKQALSKEKVRRCRCVACVPSALLSRLIP